MRLEAIERLEASLKAKLPPEYGQFLSINNGGYSHQYSIRYKDANFGTEQQADIFHWLGIGIERKRDGYLGTEEAIQNMGGLLNFDYIPIAVDASGAPILISMRRDDYGKVVFFDQEAPDTKSLSELGKTFSSFLSKLELTRRRDL